MNKRELKKNNGSEDGVTLIISVIMLAAVTFVTFALSAIILREIRNTQTILKTEPAVSAASGGGEVGLYRIMRQKKSVLTSGVTPVSAASYNINLDLYDNPYIFTLDATNPVLFVALYDPEDINNQNADYGTATINNVSTSPIKVTVFSWSNTASSLCGSPYTIAAGSSFSCTSLTSTDERYVLQVEVVGTPSGPVQGEIYTTSNSGQAKGVPSNYPVIQVTGSKGDIQRRIEINLSSQ